VESEGMERGDIDYALKVYEKPLNLQAMRSNPHSEAHFAEGMPEVNVIEELRWI